MGHGAVPPGSARHGSQAPEVLREALRLGLTSFGGPVAHLARFRDHFVRRLGWLDDSTFAETVALANSLPGPTSSQVAVAIGMRRAGLAGGIAAWVGFTAPSAAALIGFALLIRTGATDTASGGPLAIALAGVVAGLMLAAVPIVAHALVGMARSLTPDGWRRALAATVAVAAIAIPGGGVQLVALAAGAAAGLLRVRAGAGPVADRVAPPPAQVSRPVALAALAFVAAGVGVVTLGALAQPGSPAEIALAHLRAGALVFGGGHVVLPLLEEPLVGAGLVPRDVFLAGYGAALAMPGPLFAFGAYTGAVAGAPESPVATGLVMLVLLSAPGQLLLVAILPAWERLRSDRRFSAPLAGVNAAVVGLLAAALVTPVATTAIRGPVDVALALAGGVAVASGRVPVLVVVGMLALAGLIAVVGAAGS